MFMWFWQVWFSCLFYYFLSCLLLSGLVYFYKSVRSITSFLHLPKNWRAKFLIISQIFINVNLLSWASTDDLPQVLTDILYDAPTVGLVSQVCNTETQLLCLALTVYKRWVGLAAKTKPISVHTQAKNILNLDIMWQT